MTEEEEQQQQEQQEDENKRIRPRERARGQKKGLIKAHKCQLSKNSPKTIFCRFLLN